MSVSRNRCALTGSGGYIGAALRTHLENQGWDVLPLSRTNPTLPFDLEKPLPAGFFKDQGVQALVHCAYDFSDLHAKGNERNVRGSLRLIEHAEREGVGRIIFFSSMAAFAGTRSRYGRSKYEVERALRNSLTQIVRPGLVYGGQTRGVLGQLLQQVQTKKYLPVLRHEGPLFTSALDDLTAFIHSLLEQEAPAPGTPWFAAHPTPWSLDGLVHTIAVAAGKRVRTIPVPWQLVWGGLATLEAMGLRPAFRSDSVLSLAAPVSNVEIATLRTPSMPFRAFQPTG